MSLWGPPIDDRGHDSIVRRIWVDSIQDTDSTQMLESPPLSRYPSLVDPLSDSSIVDRNTSKSSPLLVPTLDLSNVVWISSSFHLVILKLFVVEIVNSVDLEIENSVDLVISNLMQYPVHRTTFFEHDVVVRVNAHFADVDDLESTIVIDTDSPDTNWVNQRVE